MRMSPRALLALVCALLLLAAVAAAHERRHSEAALQPGASGQHPPHKLQALLESAVAGASASAVADGADSESLATVVWPVPPWATAWLNAPTATPAARGLDVLRRAYSTVSGANYIAPNANGIRSHSGVGSATVKYSTDRWGRVTRAACSAVPGVGTGATGGIKGYTSAVYKADKHVDREQNAWEAGHIIAASIGGNLYNSLAINFIPQSFASNHGVYNRMENMVVGLVRIFTGANCVHVRIDFKYPATASPSLMTQAAAAFYIPTGGLYSVFIPNSCINPGPGASLQKQIDDYLKAAKALPVNNPVRQQRLNWAAEAKRFHSLHGLAGAVHKATTVWWRPNAAGHVTQVTFANP